MALAALLVPALAARFRRERIIAIGLLVAAVGFVLLSQVDGDGGQALLLAGMVLGFGGVAPLLLLMIDLVIASAPPRKAGAAGAMSETSSEFGLALGIATMGSAAAMVYRDDVSESMPSRVPGEHIEAIRDGLVDAIAVAGRLPNELGTTVASTAREAFTNGLNTVGLIGAAMMVCAAVAVATLLRNVRPQSEEDQAAEHQPDEASARIENRNEAP